MVHTKGVSQKTQGYKNQWITHTIIINFAADTVEQAKHISKKIAFIFKL